MLACHFQLGFRLGQLFGDFFGHGFGLGAAKRAHVLHIISAHHIVNRQVRDFKGADVAGFFGHGIAGGAARLALHQHQLAIALLDVHICGG